MMRRAMKPVQQTTAGFAFLVAVLSIGSTAMAQDGQRSLVDALTLVPTLKVEMRYFGTHNFVGRKIDGYEKDVCLLTRQAATALAAVQRDLEPRGLSLKVHDCYRPTRAVAHFMRWARDVKDVAAKG